MIQKNDLLIIMLCMSLLFICVKQKCNFYFQKYDILVIFNNLGFPWFWLICCYPDPDPGAQNDLDPTGSGFTNMIVESGSGLPLTFCLALPSSGRGVRGNCSPCQHTISGLCKRVVCPYFEHPALTSSFE